MPTVPQGTAAAPNMQSSVTGGRFCFTHGYYFGNTCPGCSCIMPQPPLQQHAPTVDPQERIAAALESIAASLNHLADRAR